MKIIHTDFKKGIVKLKAENLDDIWYLSTIIDIGDFVQGETFRKIRIGEKDEKSDVVKKKVYLKIQANKTEFSKHQSTLRINGEIVQGPDDIPRGSAHTISVEEGSILKIEKAKWLNYQIDKLEEASKEKSLNILIVVFDRESAIFAKLKRQGYEIISRISGKVQKKAVDEAGENFYKNLSKEISVYDKRENYNHIIIASPAFFKEYLLKEITDEKIKKKTVGATCSSVSENAINEIMKRQELQTVFADERNSKEIRLVEELLENISKNNMAVYGQSHTKKAADFGAVEVLLVTDNLIHETREKDSFDEIEKLMKTVESSKGRVHILNSENEGGKKLDSLGGLGGILRYKIE